MRKGIAVAVLIVLVAAAVAVRSGERNDRHHSAHRRAWKDKALAEIRADLGDPDYFIDRFGKEPAPRRYFDTSGEEDWLGDDTIVCADGSWLMFRNRCRKEDERIHDLFVARASDGNWYYSDFHFCIGAMVVGMRGQPDSLAAFKSEYFLESFDGWSDRSLDPTWKKQDGRLLRKEGQP